MHKLKPLSETPPKPNFQLSSAVHSLVTMILVPRIPLEQAQDASDTSWQQSMIGNINPAPTSGTSATKLSTIDYHLLSPIYSIDKVSKNRHQLNIMRIQNAILQMAYLKLYIPLSILTSALSKIHSNDGFRNQIPQDTVQ